MPSLTNECFDNMSLLHATIERIFANPMKHILNTIQIQKKKIHCQTKKYGTENVKIVYKATYT